MGPSSAITVTLDTEIPEYILDDHINLTGTSKSTFEKIRYDTKADWENGTYDNLTFSNGEVWLKPTLDFKMLNDGNAILSGGTGWDAVLMSKCLLKVNGTYFIYYSGIPSPNQMTPQIGLATSIDGINYTKYSGNPIIKKGFDAYDINGSIRPIVLHDNGTWKMWYAGKDKNGNHNVSYATSTDGYSWSKYSGNPVYTGHDTIQPVSLIKDNATSYKLYYETYTIEWNLSMATSSDGTDWTAHNGNPVRRPMKNNWENGEGMFHCIETANGTYRLWMHGDTPDRKVGYSWSKQGTNWASSEGPLLSPTAGTIYSSDLEGPWVVDEGDHYYMVIKCSQGSTKRYGAWNVTPQKLNGTYTSKLHGLPARARLVSLDWDEGNPAGGNIGIYLRWGNDTTTLSRWNLVEFPDRFVNITASYYQFRFTFDAPKDWFQMGVRYFELKVESPVAHVRVMVDEGPWQDSSGTASEWYADVALTDGDYNITIEGSDTFGNIETIIVPVMVDLYPPTGSIDLANGNNVTNSTLVYYQLEANDTHPVTHYQISRLSDMADAEWRPFVDEGAFDYKGLDGNVRLYARFKDAAGRVSEIVSDSVTVDTTNPEATVVINDGAKYTNSTDLELSIVWTDLSTVVDMKVGDTPDLTGHVVEMDPMHEVQFSIPPGDGERWAYVWLIDEAGHVTVVGDSIIIDTDLPSASFVIDGDRAYCSQLEVGLDITIHDSNPVEVIWKNEGDPWPDAWTTLETPTSVPWTLADGSDGDRTVMLMMRDAAGNYNNQTDAIVVDMTPPEGTLEIMDGAMFTTYPLVLCKLSAHDVLSGLQRIRVSNNEDFAGSAWQHYQSVFEWTLTEGDGRKTVYVQLRDIAGLVTTIDASIYLDTQAPTGMVLIEDGAEYTRSHVVNVTFDVRDDGAGLDMVRLSESHDFEDAQWQTWSGTVIFNLSRQDGLRTVYFEVRDLSGQVEIFQDTIILDRVAPTGSMDINEGEEYATQREVEVHLSATDQTSSIMGMKVSEDRDLDGVVMVPMVANFTWEFSEVEGPKELFVTVYDRAGWTLVLSDGIFLDSVPPEGELVIEDGAEWTNDPNFVVKINATDDGSGLKWVRIPPDGERLPIEEVGNYSFARGDGPTEISLLVLDAAGNGLLLRGSIILDTSPPTLTLDDYGPIVTSDEIVGIGASAVDDLDDEPVVEYRLDEGEWHKLSGDRIRVKVLTGNQFLEIRATDKAGNSALTAVRIEGDFGITLGDVGWILIVIVIVTTMAAVAYYQWKRRPRVIE
jgi:hypothetical protein